MVVLLGILSLVGLSLLLGRVFSRSLSLMPLVALAVCSAWFTLLGCLGLLRLAGWLWYAACIGGGTFVLWREKRGVLRRITPGFVFFVLGGVAFTLFYSATQPLLASFDEFTFWGTAAKVTSEMNKLYSVANSSLIANVYPPALTLVNYAMQFFGGFTEHGLIASYALIYLAGFAAASTFLDKRPAAASLLLGTLFLLPLFFEAAPLTGSASWAYVTCYADPALAAVFGGGLALVFAGGKRDGRLLVLLCLVLAMLANIKDIGFALAMLVWLVAAADTLLCGLDGVSLWGLKRWKAAGVFLALLALAAVLSYLIWYVHLSLASGENRLDFGSESSGTSLGMQTILLGGLLQLVGVGRTEEFTHLLNSTLNAILRTPVSLLGPGVRVLAVIVVLLAFTWLLCRTRAERKRVVVFAASSTLGFVAYSLFLLFLYTYVFSWVEASVLKDYDRYIMPYWQGWLTGTLVLLSATAVTAAGRTAWRAAMARLTIAGVSLCMAGAVLLRGNPQANFLRISPSYYTVRWDVKSIAETARAEGMQKGQKVYIVSQYDDGTRFYMLGFELDAVRVQLLSSVAADGGYISSATGWLRPVGSEPPTYNRYGVEVTAEMLCEYLKALDCTHLLLDEIDAPFMALAGDMFEDGLAGYDGQGNWQGGTRYWRIVYLDNGLCRFVPEGGAAA